MRNPNGYGSVVFLGKNRRLPYAVRKTIKFELNDATCTQKYKYFGYYATKAEAMIALAKINERKLDATADYTFGEMYEEWFSRHTRNLSESSIKKIASAYNKYCSPLADKSVLAVNEAMLQAIIENCDKAYQTQLTIKQILQSVMAYTQSRGLRADDPSAMLVAGGAKSVRPHKVFSVKARADMQNDPAAWTVFFLLYSGMRIEELLKIKTSDVNLSESYLVSGVKSDSGKNRMIPIHRYLLPLIKKYAGQNYLVEKKGGRYIYKEYRAEIWDVIMKKYGYDYTPHDTRHTFITMANKAGISDLYIQKIVGHTPKNTAHSVYTHIDPADLVVEVNRLD